MTKDSTGLTDSEQQMFHEVSEILNKYKGTTRNFGFSLIHSHFHLKKDEMLHETNNKIERYMLIRPLKKKEIPPKAHPTLWKISPKGKIEIAQFCCDDGYDHDNHK